MKLNRYLMMVALAAAMSAGTALSFAQAENPGPGPGPGGPGGPGGRGGRGNFDPAQFRERIMEYVKEQLEVTDDTEWKAIQPLVQKVMDTRMSTMGGGGRGPFGMGRPRGDNAQGGDQNRQRRGGFMGQTPSPEAEALQKAIDAKASKAEMKATLAKFIESRKAKQAELEQAQADLRKVLTARQEAIATLNGWL